MDPPPQLSSNFLPNKGLGIYFSKGDKLSEFACHFEQPLGTRVTSPLRPEGKPREIICAAASIGRMILEKLRSNSNRREELWVAKERTAQQPQDKPYPRPAIAEALCEIHFEPVTESKNKLEWIETFHKSSASIYTRREDKELVDYRAEVSPVGISLLSQPRAVQRTILGHADQSHIVQLSPGLMAVNETAKYPGWRVFKRHIRGNWERLASLGEPRGVHRIGLRYINRIQRRVESEPASVWLAESAYVPPLLLDCSANFLSRFEHRLDSDRRLVVTVAEEAGGTAPKPIIFDIDAIMERRTTTAWTTVETALDQLHQEVWNVFRSSASGKLVRYMEGEEP